jgi:hypothetical protein
VDAGDQKFNSCLVVPTVFRNEPFGENVEGLRRCWDKSYGSMSVFNQRGPMIECSRRIDETPFCAYQYVVQIPSPVWTDVNRPYAQKLLGDSRHQIRPHVADE